MSFKNQIITSAIAACLSFLVTFVHAYEAKVVGISDGDTITVLDGNKTQHKIRVADIDAPEKA